jgi:integrase
VIGFKLKHLDLEADLLRHDAREVRTKFSKSFPTWFFPVPEPTREIVADWVRHLRDPLGFGPDDPLFPATDVVLTANGRFGAAGLKREHWRSAQPVRTIFRREFANAGLPYFNPHSLRKTLAARGERLCRNAEQLKAWSQNLGHDDVMTTLRSYGAVAEERQRELIQGLAARRDGTTEPDTVELVENVLRRLKSAH